MGGEEAEPGSLCWQQPSLRAALADVSSWRGKDEECWRFAPRSFYTALEASGSDTSLFSREKEKKKKNKSERKKGKWQNLRKTAEIPFLWGTSSCSTIITLIILRGSDARGDLLPATKKAERGTKVHIFPAT